MNLSNREKAIACGLFLSKFGPEGLATLGFRTFKEAFNVLGLAINAKPASIKNYRDEIDPLFPNSRRGWHKRKLREHCQKMYDIFHDYDLEQMASVVSNITGCSLSLDTTEEEPTESQSFAKRLVTGRAAENFFLENFRKEPEFLSATAIDVTHTGCGYDFRLENTEDPSFNAVEVKGIQLDRGSISLTNKEHLVAERLQQFYYLYIVKNFEEIPYAVKYRNPIQSGLDFKRLERKIIQISWSTTI
jgi:hypothetical protein